MATIEKERTGSFLARNNFTENKTSLIILIQTGFEPAFSAHRG